MSDEEVYQLRADTDILLYAPVSDAFSASVTQALAAGSVVITGAWLPYKSRKISGFKYHEISNLSDAGSSIQQVIDNWGDHAGRGRENRKLAANIYSERAIGQGWVSAYKKAIQDFNEKVNKK